MARILTACEHGDGTVTIGVDVAVDVITEVTVPTWWWLTADRQRLADAVARRYAARRARLTGGAR